MNTFVTNNAHYKRLILRFNESLFINIRAGNSLRQVTMALFTLYTEITLDVITQRFNVLHYVQLLFTISQS
jgi:hypothetical protein